MAIQVTCPGCFKRFSVGEQHAGKQGKCPACKHDIKIPKLEDQVVIHEAPPEGPVDSKGRSILKTARRKDAKFQPLIAAATGGVGLVALLVAFLLRGKVDDYSVTTFTILGLAAAVIAPFIVRGGYMFLRDDELEPYRGFPLLVRSIACGLVFAASWFLYGYLLTRTTTPEEVRAGLEIWQFWPIIIMFMVGLGAGIVTLDLEPANAIMLFALYFLVTATLRVVMGLQFIPGVG